MERKMLTKLELCEKYKVSLQTINNYMKLGMPSYKIGSRMVRFDELEVEAWIKKKGE